MEECIPLSDVWLNTLPGRINNISIVATVVDQLNVLKLHQKYSIAFIYNIICAQYITSLQAMPKGNAINHTKSKVAFLAKVNQQDKSSHHRHTMSESLYRQREPREGGGSVIQNDTRDPHSRTTMFSDLQLQLATQPADTTPSSHCIGVHKLKPQKQ
uniref:Uncharacterized protein n=1 Tax=Aegilops tauschii subsp. strangulata TaxID=200361 RepID=A0A453GEV7_AEGTS